MSLFSGIGGFDLALQRCGHEIVGACEIDDYARRIYRRHFPGVKIWENAVHIKPEDLPDFDILVAGFPCQTFSVAGKRLGFEESRGTLFFEIARVAKQKRPRLLLLENVKGLLNHDGGRTFAKILATLDELGYDAEWQVLNSKYFVPQNRERIFIIGHLRGEGGRQVFPLGDFDEEANGEARIKMLLNHEHDTNRLYSTEGIARTLRANSGGMGSKTGLYAMVNDRGIPRKVDNAMAIDANYWKGMDNHGQRTMVAVPKETISQDDRVYDTEGISPSLGVGNAMSKPKISVPEIKKKGSVGKWSQRSQVFGDDGVSPSLSAGSQGYAHGYVVIPDVGITEKDGRKISNSIRVGGRGSTDRHAWDIVNDKTRIRRLTPVECERLQGFPDGWTDGLSDTQRYKCCGNAVTVPVVEYIAKNLI